MTASPKPPAKTTRLYWIPVKPQDLGYLRAGREPDLSLPHSQSLQTRYERAVHALALSLGREVRRQSNFMSKAEALIPPEGAETLQVIELRMAATDAEHLRTLWSCMARNADLCRQEGFRDGRNILTGLVNGTLSTVAAEEQERDRA